MSDAMLGVNHYESSYIPMKIQKLETFTSPYVSFVKVTTDDGMSGIGQMSTYHADITAQVFHRQGAPCSTASRLLV